MTLSSRITRIAAEYLTHHPDGMSLLLAEPAPFAEALAIIVESPAQRDALLDTLLDAPELLKQIFEDNRSLSVIGNDPLILRRVLKQSKILVEQLSSGNFRSELNLDDALKQWVSTTDVLRDAPQKTLLDEVKDRLRSEIFSSETLASHLGESLLAQGLSPKVLVEHLPPDDPNLQELILKNTEALVSLLGDKRALRVFESNPNLAAPLLDYPEFLSLIADNPVALRRVLKQSEILVELLSSGSFRSELNLDAALKQWVSTTDVLREASQKKLLDEVKERLRSEALSPATLASHLGERRLAQGLSPKVLTEHLSPDDPHLRELILKNTDALVSLLGDKRALRIFENHPELAAPALDYPEFIAFIADNPITLRRVLKRSSVLITELNSASFREELGLGAAATEWVSTVEVVQKARPKVLLDDLRGRVESGDLKLRDVINHFGEDAVAEVLSPKAIAKYMSPADPHTRERVIEDPEALHALLTDERSILAASEDSRLRNKFQVFRARERAASLPFALPAVVVSFPRSGSNFLQSVIQGSSGLRCQSIYSPMSEPPNTILTLKSHSPTRAYFEEEWGRFLPGFELPTRTIVIQRDPRDVMISFFEYTEAQRETELSQDEFLHEVDFFYASTIDRSYKRATYKKGLTIAEAYRLSIASWLMESSDDDSVLRVRYEDLVDDAQKTFKEALKFLDLSVRVKKSLLGLMVSQYSETGRPRGVVQMWRKVRDRYAVLLDAVEEEFASEISALGYGDDAAENEDAG